MLIILQKFATVKMYACRRFHIYVAINCNKDNELVNWANKWQLKINYDKCHEILIGNNNLYFDYNLDMHKIIASKCEKVLEI